MEDPAAPGVVADPSGAGGALRYLGSAAPGDASFSDGGFRATGLAPGTALALTAAGDRRRRRDLPLRGHLRLGPGPRIDAVFPAEGSNAGGVQVTITGAGLGDLAGFHVAFGDRQATALSVSDTRAVVITPPHAAGPAALTIEVADGRTRRVEEAFTFLAGRVVLLSPGWNNVTWSGPRTPITDVIAPLAPRVNRVWAWLAAEQRWRGYTVGGPAIINTLRRAAAGPGDLAPARGRPAADLGAAPAVAPVHIAAASSQGAGSAAVAAAGYDWRMTTRSDYHTDTANEFLIKGRAHLAEGDLLQASEKGWGATARMVKAVAETRGWPHTTHGDLYRTIDRLAAEVSDPRLQNLFRSAGSLHQNFYEGDMPEGTVATGLDDVEEIVGLLQAVID